MTDGLTPILRKLDFSYHQEAEGHFVRMFGRVTTEELEVLKEALSESKRDECSDVESKS
jgi:hypothetical protein